MGVTTAPAFQLAQAFPAGSTTGQTSADMANLQGNMGDLTIASMTVDFATPLGVEPSATAVNNQTAPCAP